MRQIARRPVFLFLGILVPLCLASFLAVSWLHRSERQENLISLVAEAQLNERLVTSSVQDIFRSISSDLRFLSSQSAFNAMVENPTPANLRAIESDFVQFAREKGSFDQVRYLDATGMEVVRVNYNDGRPAAVPRERLQDKSDRYYFIEGMKNPRGEIYVSPFDLNIENGQIEQPLKPAIRFSLPIFDGQSRRRGVLILNYLGENIRQAVAKGNRPRMSSLLLNEESYYLLGPKPRDEWGFMFPDRAGRTFKADFPAEWETIRTTPGGQVISRNGIFLYGAIRGVLGAGADGTARSSPREWKLVSYIPPAFVEYPSPARRLVEYLLSFLASVAVAGLLSRARHKQLVAQEGERRSFALLEDANAELSRLSQRLSRYVSPQVYKSIVSDQLDAGIATRRRKLTIFFSDIADFTGITESLEAEDLSAVMNRYFDAMALIAIRHGGTVDKFVGDAVMVFFGDPATQGVQEDATRCVAMAFEMMAALDDLRAEWRAAGIFQEIHIRIGIHTGYCAVGNFGSKEKMDYTILGRNVNIAKRLQENSAKDQILVSADTWALVAGRCRGEPNGMVRMKGFDVSIETYRLTALSPLPAKEVSAAAEPA